MKTSSTKDKTVLPLIFVILAGCLFTAVMQGSGLHALSHYNKVFILLLLFLTGLIAFVYLACSHKLNENRILLGIVFLGVMLRVSFVLLSGLYERQHDAGAFTGMGTSFINPGHIGYIEYIYKFHKLPDINPYQLFGYYHPPLHHIISCLFLKLNIALGVPEALAFENLQVLPLLYSSLCMVVTSRILKTLKVSGAGLYLGVLFIALHPATIYMSGSVNNDMLTILFMCLIILGSLQWIRDKSLRNLIRLALFIGFGMITKLNAAVLAIPLAIVFLMYLIQVIREKDHSKLLLTVKNFVLFELVVCPIGLSWIVRNLIRFREKPGVPVPGETSPMYTQLYSFWERLGIPALSDWNFAFPFHPISASACNNTWIIMFHTALFAEEYPTVLPDILLILCQISFLLSVLLGIACVILLVMVLLDKRTKTEDRVFLLSGYVIMILSFIAFVLIYPYTCSSDFRYVAICLVYTAIAIGLGNQYYNTGYTPLASIKKQKITRTMIQIINTGILILLVMITLVNQLWARW